MKTVLMKKENQLLLAYAVFAIVLRIAIPAHNLAAMTALAILAGAFATNRILSFALPIATVFLTDLATTGIYGGIEMVYLGYLTAVGVGILVKPRGLQNAVIAALGGSVAFFLISNFGVWVGSNRYTHDFNGLVQCYVMGLPFYKMSLVSDLLFTIVGVLSFTYVLGNKPVVQAVKA